VVAVGSASAASWHDLGAGELRDTWSTLRWGLIAPGGRPGREQMTSLASAAHNRDRRGLAQADFVAGASAIGAGGVGAASVGAWTSSPLRA
jgi:hypothetical protein